MKVTTAIFLVQFVESGPPVWWPNYPADQRIDILEDNVPILFETLFNTTKHAHLNPLAPKCENLHTRDIFLIF